MMTTSAGYLTKQFQNQNRKPKRSAMKTAVARAANSFVQISNEQEVPLDAVLTRVLENSIPELNNYVQQKGLRPASDPRKLVVQATILRANEVAKVARALDATDNEAMAEMLYAESEAVNNGWPDGDNVMPPEVQAAVNMMLNEIISKTGKPLNNFCTALGMGDGFDDGVTKALYWVDHMPIGTPSPGGTSLGNVSYPDHFGPYEGVPQTTQTSGGGFLDIIDKIIGGIGAVGGVIDKTKETIDKTTGGIKDIGSDIGADAISKALKENLPYILMGLAAIVLIIILIVYAAKRK